MNKIKNFWKENQWSQFDIIMMDYSNYDELKIGKKFIIYLDAKIKKLIEINQKSRKRHTEKLKVIYRPDIINIKSYNNLMKIFKKFK